MSSKTPTTDPAARTSDHHTLETPRPLRTPRETPDHHTVGTAPRPTAPAPWQATGETKAKTA
jgi:hypothetical protein